MRIWEYGCIGEKLKLTIDSWKDQLLSFAWSLSRSVVWSNDYFAYCTVSFSFTRSIPEHGKTNF